AGSFIAWQMPPVTWLFIGGMALLRCLVQYGLGRAFTAGAGSVSAGAHVFALSFLPVGGSSLAIGLTILFWDEGIVGKSAFAMAAVALIVGDLLGTRALGRVALVSESEAAP